MQLRKSAALLIMVLLAASWSCGPATDTGPTADETQAIAKEAYLYANPVVDSYRVIYGYFLDLENPEFKAPLNEIKNIPWVYTHEDKAVQTPNSDTPYSWLGRFVGHGRLLRVRHRR